MRRFSEADRQTIWDMREVGVAAKRVARHLGGENFSLRKFIADAGGGDHVLGEAAVGDA
jgi:transposase-like protein